MFRFGLWLAGLGVLTATLASLTAAGEKGAKELVEKQATKRDAKEAAKMVEEIANHNKPPKTVERRGAKPSRFPLFPKDYDWKEEARIRGALVRLEEDESIEVWESLVQKANDRRYCIASYSGSSSDVEMRSVGSICYGLAYYRLCEVFMKHLPSFPPHGSPIQMWDVIKDFPTWRKARKDKALYQLQIEVCEISLRELPKLDSDDVSDKEKAKARKKIRAEIAELRRTKKPVMEVGGIPRAYPRGEAERVRKAYEEGSLEDFRSGLNK